MNERHELDSSRQQPIDTRTSPRSPPPSFIKVRLIDQAGKTIRWLIVSGLIYAITSKLIDAVFSSDTHWIPQLIALLLPSGGCGYVLLKMAGKFRVYIENHQRGKIEIEAAVDASRTSSELTPDGRNPDVD